MLFNKNTAISTSKVLLVPYWKHHVQQYHEWMKDPVIQVATASEPLTLEEEFSMQQSWREDHDKLTFIVCQPLPRQLITSPIMANTLDETSRMVGDVNMFFSVRDEEAGNAQAEVVGEIELMIAETKQQHKGYGRSALLTFLHYVSNHEKEILAEVFSVHTELKIAPSRISLTAKVGKDNARSLSLFGTMGFNKVSDEPNFFDEFELRHETVTVEVVKSNMAEHSIEGYQEIDYY